MKTKIVLIAAIALLFASCKTTKIASTTNHERTERSAEVSKMIDSIFVYVQDSTIIRTVGDTVFCDRWKIRYRDRIKVDTLIKTDSLYINKEIIVEKEKTVEKQLSKFQQFQIDAFWWLVTAILLYIIFRLLKRKLTMWINVPYKSI
ncbi:MAG: hypothetical protein FWC39_07970 [Bacteroidetes bacterium]|nr:hypothetical protein [Bacteroidota bacterium]